VVFLHNLSWSWLVHLTMKRSSNVMLMMLSVASSTSRFRLWAGTRYRSSLRKSNVSFIRKIIPIEKRARWYIVPIRVGRWRGLFYRKKLMYTE
jgi:hypothetical protein